MSMTVVVTSNVPDRFRGFLASCMLEVAPGVYTSPQMSKGIRDRVWDVCQEWAYELAVDGFIVMTWADGAQPSGQGLRTIGQAARDLCEVDGLWLVRRDTPDPAVPF